VRQTCTREEAAPANRETIDLTSRDEFVEGGATYAKHLAGGLGIKYFGLIHSI